MFSAWYSAFAGSLWGTLVVVWGNLSVVAIGDDFGFEFEQLVHRVFEAFRNRRRQFD